MSKKKNIASIRIAIKLNSAYIWIKPKDLHEVGQFGEWSLLDVFD